MLNLWILPLGCNYLISFMLSKEVVNFFRATAAKENRISNALVVVGPRSGQSVGVKGPTALWLSTVQIVQLHTLRASG